MIEINKSKRDFEGIKFLIRTILYFSISSLIACCILTLIIGTVNSFPINYFLAIGTILILYFSIITIAIILVFQKKNEKVWNSIKKEIFLITITICSLLLLSLITSFR
jgi:hypothetical protein